MNTSTQPQWAKKLIELLDEQRGIYRQLCDLSQQQSEMIEAGQAEPLLALLGRRQGLIDELAQLNGSLEPYKNQWPRLWHELEDEARGQIEQLIGDVQVLLDRIVEQDERDRLALSGERDRLADELQHVRRGSAVNQAYGRLGGQPGNSRFTDQEG